MPGPITFGFSYKSFLYSAAISFAAVLTLMFFFKGAKEQEEKELITGLLPILLISFLAFSTRQNIIALFFVSFPLTALLFFDFPRNIRQLVSGKMEAKHLFLLTSIFFLIFMALKIRVRGLPSLSKGCAHSHQSHTSLDAPLQTWASSRLRCIVIIKMR